MQGVIWTPQLEVNNGQFYISTLHFTPKAKHKRTSGKYQRHGRKQMTLKRAQFNCLVRSGQESHQLSDRGTHNRMRHLPPPGPVGRRGPNYLGYEERARIDFRALHFGESVDKGDEDEKVSSGWRDSEHLPRSEALKQRGRSVRRTGDEFNSGQTDIRSVFTGSKEDRQFYSPGAGYRR